MVATNRADKHSSGIWILALILSGILFVQSYAHSDPQNLPDIIKKTQESVVNIQTDREYLVGTWGRPNFLKQFFQDFFEEKRVSDEKIRVKSEGSGVIIDPLGLVLTNEHVVSGAQTIRVVLDSKDSLLATLVGRNQKEDLALLKIEGGRVFSPISLGDSSTLNVGEDVVAIGNPYGYEHSVTRGIVSAKNRTLKRGEEVIFNDMLQTDTAVNPGNSGGPLINSVGAMVGLVTSIHWRAQGIGFAIPVDRIKAVLPELRTPQERNVNLSKFHNQFGFLPVESKDSLGEERVVISDILPQSGAERLGLQPGDILYQFQKRELRTLDELIQEAQKVKSGERVYLRIGRGKRTFFTYLKSK